MELYATEKMALHDVTGYAHKEYFLFGKRADIHEQNYAIKGLLNGHSRRINVICTDRKQVEAIPCS